MLLDFAAVGVFLIVAVIFIFGVLALGRLLRTDRPNPEKTSIYECGEPTIGSAWIRFNIRFYTVALVYLIFAVEAVFLFPVALVLKEFAAEGLGVLAFAEILFFALILAFGLAYAWRYGHLDWIRGLPEQDAHQELEPPDQPHHSSRDSMI